jgi:type IX secretion system PorP/SprF family membrane protein
MKISIKNIRRIGFVGIIIFTTTISNAQQIFKISQYTQHNFLVNPAAAGANDVASIGATYRKMWTGIPGGPQTALVYGDKYIAAKKTGFGAALYSDKTGPTSRTGVQANLSYSIELENKSRLQFGIGANVLQFKIDKTSFAHYIPNDPLLANDGTEIKGDAAIGVYYKSPTLNIGLSVQQIMQSKLNFVKTNANPEGKLYRHYFLMISDNIKTDESNILIPNLLIKYLPNAPIDMEAGVTLQHMDLFWVGINLHYKQSFTALAGVKIKDKFSIGYAYDMYKTPLSLFDEGGGAHEVTLRYFLSNKKN